MGRKQQRDAEAHELDELNVPGNDEHEGQLVTLYLDQETGLAGLRPESFDRLRPSQLEHAEHLQRLVAMRRQLAAEIGATAAAARDAGLSWAQIGWCVGTSGEAARQRWGSS